MNQAWNAFRHIFSALYSLSLLGLSMPAWADGTLTHLSGQVSIHKADGKTVPATVGSKAVTGDTVITGAGGFVRMEMTDGGEMVLRPDSELKIESYRYNEAQPAEDKSVFNMLKGGLRTVTGLIGKRGNKEAYEMRSATATIGIRGTQFDMRVCAGNCGALADGTYLAVRFGAVQASNSQGSVPVAAGQVAHVPPKLPPVILPRDPGVGFTPPASIPKLDEKKKVQATQAAAPAPEQPKPAAAQPAQAASQPAQASQASSQSSEAKQEAPATQSSSAPATSQDSAAAPATQGTSASGTAPQSATPQTATTGTPESTPAGAGAPTTPAAPATSASSTSQTAAAQTTTQSPAAPVQSSSANPLQGLSSPAANTLSTPQPAGVECSIQ